MAHEGRRRPRERPAGRPAGDSPVAFIDARYIVELWKRGGKILRRQDLPKEHLSTSSGQAAARRQRPPPAASPSRTGSSLTI